MDKVKIEMNNEDFWINVCAALERIAKAQERLAEVAERREANGSGF